jgi:hypothetical protein
MEVWEYNHWLGYMLNEIEEHRSLADRNKT